MFKYILLAVLFSSFSHAEENLGYLLEKLNDEDFDIREVAEKKLSDFPPSYAPIFYRLIKTYNNQPEVQHRLTKVITNIYLNKVVPELIIKWNLGTEEYTYTVSMFVNAFPYRQECWIKTIISNVEDE